MFDTLNLPPLARRALELELLARFALFVRPAALAELFAPKYGFGFLALVPRWAHEACERLLVAGELRANPAGALEVTEAGRVRVPKPVPFSHSRG